MTTEALWTIDTNVLFYATAFDGKAERKNIVALALLERLLRCAEPIFCGQVLCEYMAAVVHRQAMSPATALDAVQTWAQSARVLPAVPAAYTAAWHLSVKSKYQIWDALIIAVCAEHGVRKIYSEDAGSLKAPLGVAVINPFAEVAV